MLDRLTSLFERAPSSAEGWMARMGRSDVSARDQAGFEAWLSRNPDNLADYQALKRLLRDAKALRPDFLGEINTIPSRSPLRARPRFSWPVPAAAALAAALVALVTWPSLNPFIDRDPMAGAVAFQTAAGEVRTLVLADGTHVTLDTASAIRTRVEGRIRRVSLDRGVAFFAVAHDRTRPFEVALADRKVVVTGTQFTTGLLAGEARVTVLEGGVTVTGQSPTARNAMRGAIRLTPGDQVSYRWGLPIRREARIDIARAAPWRDGRLIFEDVPLSQVLSDLSRYTDMDIRAADPALGRKRVTAVFPLVGAEPLIDRIDRLFPVAVIRTGSKQVELRAD